MNCTGRNSIYTVIAELRSQYHKISIINSTKYRSQSYYATNSISCLCYLLCIPGSSPHYHHKLITAQLILNSL